MYTILISKLFIIISICVKRKYSLKTKHLRANNVGFINEDMQKAIMTRSQLRNHFLKHNTESSIIAYSKSKIFALVCFENQRILFSKSRC